MHRGVRVAPAPAGMRELRTRMDAPFFISGRVMLGSRRRRHMAKVLIVDDEPNIVLSLEFLMRKDGHEVRSAPDGARALALAEQFRPDLVLLDVMMPGMDG